MSLENPRRPHNEPTKKQRGEPQDSEPSPFTSTGEGGKPPIIPPEKVIPSPEEPEQREPFEIKMHQFDTEAPDRKEQQQVSQQITTCVVTALENHPRFIWVNPEDPDGNSTYRNLELNHTSEQGTLLINVSQKRRDGETSEGITITQSPSDEHETHYYIKDEQGVIRRVDRNESIALTYAPLPGEVPTRELYLLRDQMEKDVIASSKVEQELEIAIPPVGANEMAYVTQLIKEAIPNMMLPRELIAFHQRRVTSNETERPHWEDSEKAGILFSRNVNALLETHDSPSDPAFVDPDGTDVRIIIGILSINNTTTAVVVIKSERDITDDELQLLEETDGEINREEIRYLSFLRYMIKLDTGILESLHVEELIKRPNGARQDPPLARKETFAEGDDLEAQTITNLLHSVFH
jgi:hypothetical protein